MEYVSRLLGDEEVIKTSVTAGGSRLASVGETGQQMRLVPMDVIRQVAPGEGILIHRTLRPAHLHIPPYYKDQRLTVLAEQAYPPEPVQVRMGASGTGTVALLRRRATPSERRFSIPQSGARHQTGL